MSFFGLFKDNKSFFDKRDSLLVFSVFSDRVIGFILHKKNSKGNGQFQISNYTEEDKLAIKNDGSFDFETLWLGCSKIKLDLSQKIKKMPQTVLFGFCPEVSESVYFVKNTKRQNKVNKISQEEISKAVKEMEKEPLSTDSTTKSFAQNIEKVMVDGYFVETPLGFDGEELSMALSANISNFDIDAVFKKMAELLKMNYKGAYALDRALVDMERDVKAVKDAVFINIFEEKTSVFLLKSGIIEGIKSADAGYGSFKKDIEEAFSIGYEEAVLIKDKFLAGALDVNVLEKMRGVAQKSAENIVKAVKKPLNILGSVNMLPSKVFISFDSNTPIQFSQAFKRSARWFEDLPFYDNVDVSFLDDSDITKMLINTELKDDADIYIYAIINKINKLEKSI